MVLLCVTKAGFAKREKIDLMDQARSLMPSIEAYIDDRMLELEISEDLGILDLLIEDVFGNVVFDSVIDGNNGSVPLGLDLKKEIMYLLLQAKNICLRAILC